MKKLTTYIKRALWSGAAGLLLMLGAPAALVHAAADASLYFSPSSSVVNRGSTFAVSAMVNAGSNAVKGVTVDFTYNTAVLQFVSIDAVGSAFDTEGPSSGGGGTVHHERISFSGTVSGSAGFIARINFTALTTGTSGLNFSGSSAAFDANGSSVLGSKSNGLVTVVNPSTPTPAPTNPPTNPPTSAPTAAPTSAPTATPGKTATPTVLPTSGATVTPTANPSGGATPTANPASGATPGPTSGPTTTNPTIPPGSVSLPTIVPPKITSVTASYSDGMIMVEWKTDVSASSFVEYGLTDSLGLRSEGAAGTTHHVELKNEVIAAGRVIRYRVGSATASSGATSELQTITIPGDLAQGVATIKIKVVDKNNKPVVGAKVSFDGNSQTAITDKNGEATFNVLHDGQVTVSAELKGKKVTQVASITTVGGAQLATVTLASPASASKVLSAMIASMIALSILAVTTIVLVIRRRAHAMGGYGDFGSSSMGGMVSGGADGGAATPPAEPMVVSEPQQPIQVTVNKVKPTLDVSNGSSKPGDVIEPKTKGSINDQSS